MPNVIWITNWIASTRKRSFEKMRWANLSYSRPPLSKFLHVLNVPSLLPSHWNNRKERIWFFEVMNINVCGILCFNFYSALWYFNLAARRRLWTEDALDLPRGGRAANRYSVAMRPNCDLIESTKKTQTESSGTLTARWSRERAKLQRKEMKQCTIKYLSNLSVYGLVTALAYLFIIGSLGAGKIMA